VTLHDEIKIQTKQILDDVFNRRGISTEIVEKALLNRHNKSVEMGAKHFEFVVEEMRKWVAENYPSPTETKNNYQRPRALVSALIRSIEEIRALKEK